MSTVQEVFMSRGHPVVQEVFLPAGSRKCPAVLVLHGSFGLLPAYRADIVSFAEALAGAGFAAVMPHYFDSTTPKTEPGMGVLALIPERLPAWRQACGDALTAMARDSRFDAARLGVLGFSLGGNLALSLAMGPPAGAPLKCAVDFFGPTRGLEGDRSKMPPLLICHGTDDRLVSPGESEALSEQLGKAGKKKGVDFEFETYPGQGHGFKEPALTGSREATLRFFKKRL